MSHKSFRHVMIEFAEAVEPEEAQRFEELEGVEKFRKDGTQLSFELHGNLDSVIKLAAGHEVVDMIYERPSLEEIFLAYYGGEGSDEEASESREEDDRRTTVGKGGRA